MYCNRHPSLSRGTITKFEENAPNDAADRGSAGGSLIGGVGGQTNDSSDGDDTGGSSYR